MLDTCQVENVMDYWSARDSIWKDWIVLEITHQIVALSVL